jgi:hypothetical protein
MLILCLYLKALMVVVCRIPILLVIRGMQSMEAQDQEMAKIQKCRLPVQMLVMIL